MMFCPPRHRGTAVVGLPRPKASRTHNQSHGQTWTPPRWYDTLLDIEDHLIEPSPLISSIHLIFFRSSCIGGCVTVRGSDHLLYQSKYLT